MSALTDIKNYWATNSALQAAIPLGSVWFGLVPPPSQQSFPRAVITTISSNPQLTTGDPYFEEYHFQISLYGANAAALEIIADAVDDEFQKTRIATRGMGCYRLNRQTLTEQITDQVIYHVALDFLYRFNASL